MHIRCFGLSACLSMLFNSLTVTTANPCSPRLDPLLLQARPFKQRVPALPFLLLHHSSISAASRSLHHLHSAKRLSFATLLSYVDRRPRTRIHSHFPLFLLVTHHHHPNYTRLILFTFSKWSLPRLPPLSCSRSPPLMSPSPPLSSPSPSRKSIAVECYLLASHTIADLVYNSAFLQLHQWSRWTKA